MNLIQEKKNNTFIFRLGTEYLDSTVAPALKAAFLLAIEQGEKNFLVNLYPVSYVDSSGLGALLFGLRHALEKGGDLKLACAAPRILKLIKIAHLEEQLLIYKDEEEAIQAFSEENTLIIN